jgi:hypothetical protein
VSSDGRFSTETILTLSRRAALQCSNPDCGAITSGPTEEASSSINIGEAAHIYGRSNSAARYKVDLTMAEVSDITNGIWLCRNCHKMIDNDSLRHPAELLFEWRRLHERAILDRLGRPGDKLREKLRDEHLRSFQDKTRLAQQIILDRPPFWESKLTAELLRTELGPIYQRWQQLQRGMYVRKSTIVPDDQLSTWIKVKFDDVANIAYSLKPILAELNKAFGPPGQPGSDTEILTICNLIVTAAKNLLEWEEDVKFLHVEDKFKEVFHHMQGVAGEQLDQLLRIPNELKQILAKENPSGVHKINLVCKMPDNFAANFHAALERAYARNVRPGN